MKPAPKAPILEILVRIKSGLSVRPEVHAGLEKAGLVETEATGKTKLTPEGERTAYWPQRELFPQGMRAALMEKVASLNGKDETIRAAIEETAAEQGIPTEKALFLAVRHFCAQIRHNMGIGSELSQIRRLSKVASDISRPKDVTQMILRQPETGMTMA